ncbi:Uma2 family endonuclease [Scytonema sp. NUACC21]
MEFAVHSKISQIFKERDYIAKRIQYQDCRISEYWIVDPQTHTILILELRRDSYIIYFRHNNLST